MNEADKKKPVIEYRVELEKRIQINRSFSERRNQALAMRILSYGLFGKKRYQNLYLVCSLNCFHLGLKIANQIHQRVAGLSMIIKFETVQVLEYFAEEFEGKFFEEKKFSKIQIKLTKNPTEEDKKEPGYVPCLSNDEVEEPLTEVMKRKRNEPRRGRQKSRENRPKKEYHERSGHHQAEQRRDRNKYRYRETRSEKVREQNDQRGIRKQRGGMRRYISKRENAFNRYEEEDDRRSCRREMKGDDRKSPRTSHRRDMEEGRRNIRRDMQEGTRTDRRDMQEGTRTDRRDMQEGTRTDRRDDNRGNHKPDNFQRSRKEKEKRENRGNRRPRYDSSDEN